MNSIKNHIKSAVNNDIILEIEKNTDKKFTKEDIINLIDFNITVYEMRNPHISDGLKKEIIDEFLKEAEIPYETGMAIVNQYIHKPWVNTRDIEFKYWTRYQQYLINEKHWSEIAVRNLKTVSKEILDLCGDPVGDQFKIKGLIMGDVQSGKTSNYTAICNMAADSGYKVIIVLAGLQNDLRSQTQERLDKEFTGRRTNSANKLLQKMEPIGVGIIDRTLKITSLTSVANDFRKNNIDLSLKFDSLNNPVLLVLKKNASTLKNLNDWLRSNHSVSEINKIHEPLLLIDDESDNASINTNSQDNDPTKINDLIRKLLDQFDRSTYLAVTATPFANIFIDDKDESDLFPSDFIYALTPPETYLGASRIFLNEEERAQKIVEINEIEMESLLPLRHKKDHVFNQIPTNLKEAVCYFLLTNAILDLRGDENSHRSMMVHISRFINVQSNTAAMLETFVDDIKSDVKNYGRTSYWNTIDNLYLLETVWNKFNLGSLITISFESLLAENLYDAIKTIHVLEVNGNTKTRLDYSLYENGRRIIAVGGQSFSRGLTLEGLIVSYFYRSTIMYDTLMQMGRWFGYRTKYEDLVKIWMTPSMTEYFSHITEAANELRESIEEMNLAGKSPRDFGLKVRQDPNSVLMITARNKMRGAVTKEISVNLSKKVLETFQLKADINILRENEALVRKFIDNLSVKGKLVDKNDERAQGNIVWTDVPSDYVSEFIRKFDVHEALVSYNKEGISRYIASDLEHPKWDIAIVSGKKRLQGVELTEPLRYGDKTLPLEHTELRTVIYSPYQKSLQFTNNRRLGSQGQTKLGLTQSQIKEVEEKKKDQEKLRKKNLGSDLERTSEISFNDRDYLIKERNPLLIIHVVNTQVKGESQSFNIPEFLFGLTLGFPESDRSDQCASYAMNYVFARDYLGVEDDE